MTPRERMFRHLGVRETLEMADDLADRIEATDPACAALLRTFRRDAAAALIRWQPNDLQPAAADQDRPHPAHGGVLQ